MSSRYFTVNSSRAQTHMRRLTHATCTSTSTVHADVLSLCSTSCPAKVAAAGGCSLHSLYFALVHFGVNFTYSFMAQQSGRPRRARTDTDTTHVRRHVFYGVRRDY
eukprot:3665891-Prymnesium_polylepis.1